MIMMVIIIMINKNKIKIWKIFRTPLIVRKIVVPSQNVATFVLPPMTSNNPSALKQMEDPLIYHH